MDSRTEGWGNWKNGIEAGFSDRAVKRRRAEAARRAGQPPPRSSKSIAGLDYALIPVAIERPGQVGPGRAPKGASGQGLTGWLDYFLVSFSVAFSASNVALSISTLGSVVGRRPRRDVHHRRRRERATTKIHQRNRGKNYTRKPIPECTFKRLPSIVFFFFKLSETLTRGRVETRYSRPFSIPSTLIYGGFVSNLLVSLNIIEYVPIPQHSYATIQRKPSKWCENGADFVLDWSNSRRREIRRRKPINLMASTSNRDEIHSCVIPIKNPTRGLLLFVKWLVKVNVIIWEWRPTRVVVVHSVHGCENQGHGPRTE